MDPNTTAILTKKVLDIAEPHIKWFTDYMSFKMFGKEFFIEKAIAEAEAEVESKKVLAKWEFELNREKIWNDYILVLEKAEKEVEYKNLISVMEKAKWKINENAEWNIDPDKMQRLKNLAKEYSSDEMQDYIAKILAWEYNKSWTYSLQTMDIIKTLSKEEIKLFLKFKSTIFDKELLIESVFNNLDDMNKFNINYNELLLLSSLNLIALNSSVRWLSDIWDGILPFEYNWKVFWLKYKWKKTINWLYFLTRAWKELYWLLDDNYDQNFIEHLKKFYNWKWVELINQK